MTKTRFGSLAALLAIGAIGSSAILLLGTTSLRTVLTAIAIVGVCAGVGIRAHQAWRTGRHDTANVLLTWATATAAIFAVVASLAEDRREALSTCIERQHARP